MAMMAAPTLGEGALVCSDAEFAGEVHVGEGSILHPRCRILARGGPIRIGRNNVIEELVEIVNDDAVEMVIGDDNLFQVGCSIASSSVGSLCVFEVKAAVGAGSTVGSGCVVGTTVALPAATTLQSGTVAFRLGDETRFHAPRDLAAEHAHHISKYAEILRGDSKSSLLKHHKLLPN